MRRGAITSRAAIGQAVVATLIAEPSISLVDNTIDIAWAAVAPAVAERPTGPIKNQANALAAELTYLFPDGWPVAALPTLTPATADR